MKLQNTRAQLQEIQLSRQLQNQNALLENAPAALETVMFPQFTLFSHKGQKLLSKDFQNHNFVLVLLFNELGCSDCIWKALRLLNNRREEILQLGGGVFAIADSTALKDAKKLAKALNVKFPILLASSLESFFPDTLNWHLPTMLLWDTKRDRVIYSRFENGYTADQMAFVDKALRLYHPTYSTFPSLSDKK